MFTKFTSFWSFIEMLLLDEHAKMLHLSTGGLNSDWWNSFLRYMIRDRLKFDCQFVLYPLRHQPEESKSVTRAISLRLHGLLTTLGRATFMNASSQHTHTYTLTESLFQIQIKKFTHFHSEVRFVVWLQLWFGFALISFRGCSIVKAQCCRSSNENNWLNSRKQRFCSPTSWITNVQATSIYGLNIGNFDLWRQLFLRTVKTLTLLTVLCCATWGFN